MTAPSWLSVKPMGRPRVVDGQAQFTVEVRLRWWSISFLRWVRARIEVEPAFLAWPIVVWIFLRWRLSAWVRRS